jgi:hypothetical protein
MNFDHHLILALFHIFFVVPLFFLIAFFRKDMPVWAYNAILGLGLFVLAYQAYKLVVRLQAHSSYAWVNAIHVLFIAPLLIYIGFQQKETIRAAYELCIMVGSAALGYHTYSLVQQINTVPDSD